tara:strand:+ start:50 stop:802 length:753 start_codon:yes stop_codon:yes gene_type:complete
VKPKVSVIMPVFNAANVELSIDGVLSQTYKDLELIIIDDHSNEDIAKVLERVAASDNRVIVVRNDTNEGAGVSRNIGLRKAKYDLIAFCDSDDFWVPNKLEVQLTQMIKEDAPICCGGFVKKHQSTNKISKPMFPPPKITHNDLLKTCSIVMSTAVINRKITGYFEMPTARMRQDFGMWLQLTNKGYWALGLDKILVEIGYGHQSVSSNKFLSAFYHWKTVRKYSNISFLVMSVYFFSYAFNGIRKYFLR